MRIIVAVIFLAFLGASCDKVSIDQIDNSVYIETKQDSQQDLTTFSTLGDLIEGYQCSTDNYFPCLKEKANNLSLSYESFVMLSLSDQPKLSRNHITAEEALLSVQASSVSKQLLTSIPKLFEQSSVYSSREVEILSEVDLWFNVDASIQSYYDDYLNRPIWQILIPCKDPCPTQVFIEALNNVAPIESQGGAVFSDLVFVVDALNGDVLFYQRSSGKRGDAVNFVVSWVPINNQAHISRESLRQRLIDDYTSAD